MPHLSASLEPPPALVNNLSAYFLQHSLRKLLRWVGVYASECVWSRYPKNKSQSNNFWFLSAGHPPTNTTYNNNTQSRTGHVSKIHHTNTLYIDHEDAIFNHNSSPVIFLLSEVLSYTPLQTTVANYKLPTDTLAHFVKVNFNDHQSTDR